MITRLRHVLTGTALICALAEIPGTVNASAPAATKYKTLHVKIVTAQFTVGAFLPRVIKVHRGQRVVFSNQSDASHTVTSDDGKSFNSKDLAATHTWSFTPKHVGTFAYTCQYHPDMHGKIVVAP